MDTWVWILIIVAAVVVLVAIFMAMQRRKQADSHREAQGGLFSRVRDAFNGR